MEESKDQKGGGGDDSKPLSAAPRSADPADQAKKKQKVSRAEDVFNNRTLRSGPLNNLTFKLLSLGRMGSLILPAGREDFLSPAERKEFLVAKLSDGDFSFPAIFTRDAAKQALKVSKDDWIVIKGMGYTWISIHKCTPYTQVVNIHRIDRAPSPQSSTTPNGTPTELTQKNPNLTPLAITSMLAEATFGKPEETQCTKYVHVIDNTGWQAPGKYKISDGTSSCYASVHHDTGDNADDLQQEESKIEKYSILAIHNFRVKLYLEAPPVIVILSMKVVGKTGVATGSEPKEPIYGVCI